MSGHRMFCTLFYLFTHITRWPIHVYEIMDVSLWRETCTPPCRAIIRL